MNSTSNIGGREKLTGYIEHRLQFSSLLKSSSSRNHINHSHYHNDGRKRNLQKLNEEQEDEHDDLLRNQRETLCSSVYHNINDNVGFYFIQDKSNEDQTQTFEVRVIVPQSMMKIVCDVVRFRSKVTLHKYSTIGWVLKSDDDENGDDTAKAQTGIFTFIELHHDGLVVLCSKSSSVVGWNDSNSSLMKTTSFMSLLEMQEEESNIENKRKKIKNEATVAKGEGDKKTQYFNIRGRVDAVSTIIAMVPTDPFALIELYDPSQSCISTIIVLKGTDALQCQPGILPGDDIAFFNITRSRWHVPQSFRKDDVPPRMYGRAPPHVFVVTHSRSVRWNSSKNITAPINIFPLPDTVDSLSSIQGKITSIQYSQVKDNTQNFKKQISSIISIHLENNEDITVTKYYKLYLFYHPMSPELYFGITIGAFIRAVNVHRIPIGHFAKNDSIVCYGSCLRSTVTILVNGSDEVCGGPLQSIDNITGEYPKYPLVVQRKIPKVMVLQNPFYFFSNNTNTYSEYEWFLQSRLECCRNSDESDKILNTLQSCLTIFRETVDVDATKRTRDPYKEFFDHVCECEIGDHDESRISLCPSINQNALPVIVNLSRMMTDCVEIASQNLLNHAIFSNEGNTSSSPIAIGWTISTIVSAKKLEKMYQSRNCFNTTTPVYTAGFVSEVSFGGTAPTQIHNASCSIPLVPLQDRHKVISQVKDNYPVGSFILVKVSRLIATSFYLGKSRSDCGDIHSANIQTSNLPPTIALSPNIKCGPCRVIVLRGHLFLLSIQIHYNYGDAVISAKSKELSVGDMQDDLFLLSKYSSPINLHPLTKLICNNQNATDIENASTHRYYVGRFVRYHWKPRKIHKGIYNGCTMTISYLPTGTKEINFENLVRNQAVDIDLNISLKPINVMSMKKAVGLFLSLSLHEEVLSIACAWRSLAEKGFICSTIIDDSNSSEPFITRKVFVPYINSFMGHSQSIDSIRLHVLKSLENVDCPIDLAVKSMVALSAGRLKLPGDLDSIVNRGSNIKCGFRKRELVLPAESFDGVPSFSLMSLSYKLFHELNLSQSAMQMVCRIADAYLSTLKYCAVKIQCTKCFQFLVDKDRNGKRNNLQNCALVQITERSNDITFWDRPLPMVQQRDEMKKSNHCYGSERILECPNGCEYHHAVAKWELSGIVEDRTGSAKLYAERESVVMLLGEGLDVKLIEQGAWTSSSGIVFQRGIPLKNCISSAQRLSFQQHNAASRVTSNKYTKNILMFSPSERAKIALYHHCVKTREAKLQTFDLLCRCKRISKSKPTFNRFEMNSISALGKNGKVIQLNHNSTMSPIVELHLLDCIRCLHDSTQNGWSIKMSL